jgi:hypothetical protein
MLLLQGAAPADSPIVGIWYGKGGPNDPEIHYVDFFGPDGSFLSEYRKYDGCEVTWKQVEAGTWSLDGDVQTLVKSSVNGMPVHAKQDYVIEGTTSREIRARHIGTSYLFVERRLERFEFPFCGAGV